MWDVPSGNLRESILNPTELGLQPATLDQLRGGDARFNAQVVSDILAGRADGNYSAIRDVVALNAAATMVAYDAATQAKRFGEPTEETVVRIARALPVAYGSIDSGAARSLLDVWVSISQRYALSAS
jgi:anthranilate phosphoribosyltransferase